MEMIGETSRERHNNRRYAARAIIMMRSDDTHDDCADEIGGEPKDGNRRSFDE